MFDIRKSSEDGEYFKQVIAEVETYLSTVASDIVPKYDALEDSIVIEFKYMISRTNYSDCSVFIPISEFKIDWNRINEDIRLIEIRILTHLGYNLGDS